MITISRTKCHQCGLWHSKYGTPSWDIAYYFCCHMKYFFLLLKQDLETTQRITSFYFFLPKTWGEGTTICTIAYSNIMINIWYWYCTCEIWGHQGYSPVVQIIVFPILFIVCYSLCLNQSVLNNYKWLICKLKPGKWFWQRFTFINRISSAV